ncbi:hypothetical protein PS862_05862 [Pseudomonas fluorescens]|uniref:Uncharacterized protein n=1 Tax=Pseudomonas fluorescens TaxID=294 RepID=A0A5E7QFG9_PSEFL|nr:hypothetical protein PS862_05862 [Pseudomonas fluorescens]
MLGFDGRSSIFEIQVCCEECSGGFQSKRFEAQSA